MQGPEARTCVHIRWTGVASINVLIFSSVDRGMTGQRPEDLSEARKVEFGRGPRPPDPPRERSHPFKANRE